MPLQGHPGPHYWPPPSPPSHPRPYHKRARQHTHERNYQLSPLPLTSSDHLAIPLIPKTHPRVLSLPAQTGHIHAQLLLEPLARTVRRRHNRRPHLGVVLQREFINSAGVFGPRARVLGEGAGSLLSANSGAGVGRDVLVEDGEEHADVLEAGVHALAVERHHGVGGVADDDGGGGEVVWTALDGYQREVRVLRERGDEGARGDECRHAGKVLVEEGRESVGLGFQEVVVSGWKEERARE